MSQAEYDIEVRQRMVERWRLLEAEYPEDMQWFKDFLNHQPTNTHITNGKIKKLRGDLKHLYQYDVSYKDRVRYSVDRENHIVRVVFARGHP